MDVVKIILELLTGEEVDEDELDEVMEEYDEDESGEIEFAEFVKLASHFVEPEEDYETMKCKLRDLFVFYDREQRGFIPAAEFKAILKELDPEMPDTEIEEMVKEIDADSSGTIEFDGKLLFLQEITKFINIFLYSTEFIEVMLGEDEDKKKE